MLTFLPMSVALDEKSPPKAVAARKHCRVSMEFEATTSNATMRTVPRHANARRRKLTCHSIPLPHSGGLHSLHKPTHADSQLPPCDLTDLDAPFSHLRDGNLAILLAHSTPVALCAGLVREEDVLGVVQSHALEPARDCIYMCCFVHDAKAFACVYDTEEAPRIRPEICPARDGIVVEIPKGLRIELETSASP